MLFYDWFVMLNWTFETKIINTDIEVWMYIAIIETIYREPDRRVQPYFNRMAVSYV